MRGRRQDSHSANNRNPGPSTPISEDPCETDSGVAYALVGREATPRLRSLPRWRSLSRVEGGMLVIAVVGLLLNLLGVVDPSAQASVVGHATGLVVGVIAGVGERYVSVDEA